MGWALVSRRLTPDGIAIDGRLAELGIHLIMVSSAADAMWFWRQHHAGPMPRHG